MLQPLPNYQTSVWPLKSNKSGRIEMKTLKTSPKSVWINFSFVVKRMANGATIYCVLFGGLCHFTQDHSCIFLAVRFWSNLSFIANALLIGSPIFSFWCMIGHLQVAFQQVSISVYWPIKTMKTISPIWHTLAVDANFAARASIVNLLYH